MRRHAILKLCCRSLLPGSRTSPQHETLALDSTLKSRIQVLIYLASFGIWFITETSDSATAAVPMFSTRIIEINGAILNTEIADTQEKRVLGLSKHKYLPEDEGMLFIYNTSKVRYFTMKETNIPLSIAFIDEDFIIREIIKMKPNGKQLYHSKIASMYALEVNQGWFKKNTIRPGHKIQIR